MPVTCACFAAGALALSGVFPTAGFFSKDEVLGAVLTGGHPVGFGVLVATAGMTAFYIGRAFLVAAFGSGTAGGHPHDPPASMRGPLVLLALLAVGTGFAAPLVPGLFAASIAPSHAGAEHAPIFVPILGTAAALSGLALAWAGYQRRLFDPAGVRRAFSPLVTVLERRWFVDDVFAWGYRVVYLGISNAVGWTDRYVVDGLVNAVSWMTWTTAGRLTAIQSGRVQDALYGVALGLVFILWLAWGR
jgi:NADH-quinone oxidoreductase subunit L